MNKVINSLPVHRGGRIAWCLAIWFVLAASTQAQTLLHRYSFTADASDSVGGADGTLQGDAVIQNGAVVLDGVVPTYVDLPADLVTNLSSFTFETWLTWNGGAIWQRVFDFGNSTTGQGVQGAATSSACLTPNDGGVMGTFLYPTNGGFDAVNTNTPLSIGFLHQVVWAYDHPSTTATMYIDGKAVNVNTNQTFSLPDLGPTENDWLGHSQYYGDPDFVGTISEFRIYDGALSAAAVTADYTNGPDMGGRGALQDIRLMAKTPMRAGASQQLQVAADFLNVSNLQFTLDPAVTYKVSDTSILSVSTNGVLTSLGAATAAASVVATYQGHSVTQAIQVIAFTTPVLIHRYSFTSDASDSVGGANGSLGGDAVISNGTVVLDGSAYVQLPGDFCDSLTNVTFEFWLTWNGGGLWQHIFDFGNNDGGNGGGFGGAFHDINLVAKDGGAATDGGNLLSVIVINGNGVDSQVSAPPMSPFIYHHLVWTYDELSSSARLYLDGVQVGVGTMTDTFNEFSDSPNCWLGQSQYGPMQDPDFSGSIDEFRIYDGTLSAAAVATDFANGANNTGPGNLLDIRIIGRTNMLAGSGAGQQLTVVADYQNVSGIDISSTSQTSYSVSDASILSVTPTGFLNALAPTTNTVSVTVKFQSKTAILNLQIYTPTPPVLIHRYSFTADASDALGTANGTLQGDAVCSNGAVVLDGHAYVELPANFCTNLTNVTFEFWLTWNGGGIWQHIFDFGNNDGGNGGGFGNAIHDINLVAKDGGAATDGGNHMAIIVINGQGVLSQVSVPPMTTGVEHHLVWTYDAPSTTAEIYVDGLLAGFSTDMTNTFAGFADAPNCWLGQSQYGPGQDPDFNGSIDEFRIYTGTFTSQQAAFDYLNGPNIVASPVTLAASFLKGQITLAWPVANSSGYNLQSSPVLGTGASWSAAGSPTVSNGLNQITVQPTGGAKFYRLKR